MSDLGERAHHIAFGFPADLSPEERADLTAEISALIAAIRAEATSAQEALFKHRLAAFVGDILHGDEAHKRWLWDAAHAFLAAEPVPKPRPTESVPTWDDAVKALHEEARLPHAGVHWASLRYAADWLASVKPQRERK